MKYLLNERALLKISGSDAESFLQNQFSNDITKLENSKIQLNAYCQHHGKIIGLFWVMRYDEYFLISFPNDLLEVIKSRLQMFVIMSDVVIEDMSESYKQIGLIGEKQLNAYLINDHLSLLIDKSKEKNEVEAAAVQKEVAEETAETAEIKAEEVPSEAEVASEDVKAETKAETAPAQNETEPAAEQAVPEESASEKKAD